MSDFLNLINIFSKTLSQDDLEYLASKAMLKNYSKGEVVLDHNDFPLQ